MTPLALDVVVKASLMLSVAAAVQAMLRGHGTAAARHLVWTSTLAGILVLPVADASLPPWRVTIPVAGAARAATMPTPLTPEAPSRARDGRTNAEPVRADVAVAARSRGGDTGALPILAAMALAVYACGVLILLSRLLLERTALRQLARRSRAIDNDRWNEAIRAAASRLNVARPIALRVGDAEQMPMTFGVRRATLLVPPSAIAWSADRRDAVLLHELAHVARHDCLTQTLAGIACAFYWWHPGVWWAARRLRIERELACDDQVIAAGTEPRDYAGHLLDIARAFGRLPAPAAALGVARTKHLEQRLRAVLDDARNRRHLTPRSRALVVAASLAAIVPIAALRAAAGPSDRTPPPGPQAPAGAARQATSSAAATDSFAGVWELRPSHTPGHVNLTMRTLHSSNGTTLPLARLEGLTQEQIASAAGTVRFVSRRDAGSFTFSGVCHAGLCGGTYAFDASPGFAAELTKRGVGSPTAQQQYELAREDAGIALLDALKAGGYPAPDVQTLVRAAEHGIDVEYVQGMAGLGYRLGSLDPLIRMRDHGVDPEYVRGLAQTGLSALPAETLVRARDHGVDPEYVGGMRKLGFGSESVEDFIKARDHGVDPALVRGMTDLGYHLDMAELLQARDHGVDPEYARRMKDLGYDAAIRDLVKARDHGVDPEYVRGLAALGYRSVPLESLIRMRDHGVDPEYVRRLQRQGGEHLTIEQLIERRDRGEDDPSNAARAALASVQAAWQSIVSWLRT